MPAPQSRTSVPQSSNAQFPSPAPQRRMHCAPAGHFTFSQLLAPSQVRSQRAPALQWTWQLLTSRQSIAHWLPTSQSARQSFPGLHATAQYEFAPHVAWHLPPARQSKTHALSGAQLAVQSPAVAQGREQPQTSGQASEQALHPGVVHTPCEHVSPSVQARPSSHGVPSSRATGRHVSPSSSQEPSTHVLSCAVQSRAEPPVHTLS
jgi:hypothetical protein